MTEYFNTLDTQLFLFLNGLHCSFFDPIMYWFSNKWIWLPMYLIIAFFIIRNYKSRGVLILLFIVVVIAVCDQTSTFLIKNNVQRLRPSHEPGLIGLVHLSKAGPGGLYGFVSSHAANAFGFVTFIMMVLDNRFRFLKYGVLVWAFLVSYSRIYNGVHYPADVLAGIILGILTGWIFAKIYAADFMKKLLEKH